MRATLTYLAYPAVLAAAGVTFFALVPALGVEGAQTPSTFAGIATIAVLERVIPKEASWNRSRGDFGNYGAVTIFWDIVFGTRVLPAHAQPATDIGIDGGPDYVQGSFGALLMGPFVRERPWRPRKAPSAHR